MKNLNQTELMAIEGGATAYASASANLDPFWGAYGYASADSNGRKYAIANAKTTVKPYMVKSVASSEAEGPTSYYPWY